MPYLIENIDKIARDKGRDVLFVRFDKKLFEGFDYEDIPVRKRLIQWFEENKITAFPCGDVASEHLLPSYQGQLYIDVPFDETDPDYVKISGYLENPDGTPRIPGVLFCCLKYALAMKNRHHDAPGFWEKWAENF